MHGVLGKGSAVLRPAFALERIIATSVVGLPMPLVAIRFQLALVRALDALLVAGRKDDVVRIVVDTVCKDFENQEECRAELEPIVEEIASTNDQSKIEKLLNKAIELVLGW